MKPIKHTVRDIIVQYEDCIGFLRFGSKDSRSVKSQSVKPRFDHDIDLWSVWKKKQGPAVRKQVSALLCARTSGQAHHFFVQYDDFKIGRIVTVEGAAPIWTFFKNGLDHHNEDMMLRDYSMLSVFLYATMHPFEGESILSEKAIRKALALIKLTTVGASCWIAYYTACFLDKYLHSNVQDKKTLKYKRKLAKTLIRVTLGFILSQMEDGEQLQSIKREIIRTLRNGKGSFDLRLAKFINTGDYKLGKQHRKLLKIFGRLRDDGNNVDSEKYCLDFVNKAEKLIFHLAAQQGIPRDVNFEGYRNILLGYIAKR